MERAIHRVTGMRIRQKVHTRGGICRRHAADYQLSPLLVVEMYGPLLDRFLVGRVRVDRETHTVVWPSGADFHPATLRERAQQWEAVPQVATAS